MIIYKSGGKIRKAQSGGGISVTGVSKDKPKKNYMAPSQDLFYATGNAIGQEFGGDDPDNEGQYFTQGQHFADSNRINTMKDNYKGTNTMITRDEYNDYNTSQQGYIDRDMEYDDNTGIATGLGKDPWEDYNSKYGENSILRTMPTVRQELTEAFKDNNLNAAEYSKGDFTQTYNNGMPYVNPEQDGRTWGGLSRFVRQKQEIPGAEAAKATGLSTGSPIQMGAVSMPEAAKADPKPVSLGRQRPLKVSKNKTREQRASKKAGKRKNGGLIY